MQYYNTRREDERLAEREIQTSLTKMAYQQGSYDYYSQSQYAATPDPSYSSQSYPSQVSYTTTSSEQDISSYQTQGYAAVTDTSASGDNQGSHSYQSYPYTSSYDYGNVATQEQANYSYSQSSETYGSSYDSTYSQTNTSGENLGQSASVAVAGGQDQYYYSQSQSQAQGDSYYTEYQTSSTASTVTNQPPLTQSQYASYGSAPGSAAPHSNVNTASDHQAYQYDYSNTNASNNANVTTSQTQDWTGNSSQGQAAGFEQSSSYYNSTPQVPYGSTQTQATSDYTQVDQSYYNTRPTYDQNVPSGQGYVQQPQVSSGPEVPKQNQVPTQQHYGEQPRFDARPAIASYQASSQPDWNTRTAQNTGTGSQFAGQSGQQSSRTFPPKNEHTFQNSASQQNKPTFSSVIEHLAKLQEMSKTKSHPDDGKRQSSTGDQTQQKGPGTTPSNLRPIMPSSGPPRMHSRQQPMQRNVKPSDNRQSFSPTRGNQNVANRKGSGGLDRTIGQGRMPGSQGQFPPNQQQGRQEQNRQQYKGPHKMESKGPGSLSNSRPMSSGRPGHISKGGHNNQGQSMGGDKMSPHRSRIPGVGPRGPHFNQQGGDNWKGPRGADQKFPRGPGHMASPRGPDGMPVRGPGPRMGSPMPPRGPYPPHPKGSSDMPAPKPGSSPQKRKRSMEDDKKSDKRSQRMPDSPPPEIGRQQGPPFRPRGPHDRFFRFGMRPPGEMFGPRFRGPPPDMFFDGPRGMRLRPPFGPRHPGPWDAPPEFMHRMRGRFPFPFWEGKHDRDDHGPPSMLEPLRKRRRSSGSGDDLGPMSGNRGDPSRDAPRGPHPRHPPADVLRGLPPMHRPDKNSVPQFTGTKAGKFGKSLTERKKMEGSDAKKVVKKGTDTKFQCDVCQVGFNTKDSQTDHTKQHKNCDVEDCGFEGIPRVLQLHKQQAHQPNIPSVKWSRDKEDVQSWLEDRKRNFPTAATIAAKKAVQEDKERMGAVLTTKEFGKMKRKKQDGGKPAVDGGGDKERKEGDNERQEDTVEDEMVAEEGDKTKAGEDRKVNETESKEETEDGEKTRNKEDEKERPKGEETGSKEEAEKRPEGVAAGDEGEGRGKEKTEMSADVKMEKDDKTVAKDEEKGSALKDKEEDAKADDAKADDGEDHPTRALSDAKEIDPAKKREVTFQVVKREVKRLKSGKASKREPWRTNKPVQKFISTAGGSRRATLLEMLLAPEMRHERNLLLQCVRYTVRNNFFEPKKEVSTKSGTADLERKSSAESAKEQTEKSGTDISSNSSPRDEGAGNANEGVTSDKQECKDRTAKDETDKNVTQRDAKIHQEKSETAAVMDATVKDEEDEDPVSRKDGDDKSSVESAGKLVSASESREQTLSAIEEKGESDQKEENAICGDQSRLDADSESTSKMTDEEMDSREGGENGVEEAGKHATDEKMETDGEEQQGALPTEEAVVSAEDSTAVSIVEADGSEEEQDKVVEEDAINVSHTQMEDVEMLEDTKEVEDEDTGDDDSDDDVNDDDDVSDDNGVKDETEGVDEMVQADERQASEADELQKEEPESEGREDDTKALEDKDDDNDDVVDKTEAVEEMAEQDEDGEDNQTAEAHNLQEEELDLTGRKDNMNTGVVESQREEESQDDKNTGEGEVQEELEVEKRDDGLNQTIETEVHDARKTASDETTVGEIAEEDGEKLEEITKMEITNEMFAGKNDETAEKGTPKEEAVATEADTKDEGKAKTNQEAEEEESQPKATSKKVRLRRSSRRKR